MAKKKFNIDLTEKTSQSVDEDVFLINDSAENDITKKTKYIKGRNIGKIDRKTGVTDAQKQSLLKINSEGNVDYTNVYYASSIEELKTLLLDAAHKHIIITNTIQIQMGGDIEVKCVALISCGSKLQVTDDLNFLNTSPYSKTLIFDCRLEAPSSKTITASNNDLTLHIKELKGDFQWTGGATYNFNIKVSTLVSGTNTTTNATFTSKDNTYWQPVLEQVKLLPYTITATDVTNGYITISTEEILELILGRTGSFQDSGYTINSPANGDVTITDLLEGEIIFLIYKI